VRDGFCPSQGITVWASSSGSAWSVLWRCIHQLVDQELAIARNGVLRPVGYCSATVNIDVVGNSRQDNPVPFWASSQPRASRSASKPVQNAGRQGQFIVICGRTRIKAIIRCLSPEFQNSDATNYHWLLRSSLSPRRISVLDAPMAARI
jgi:hypothetical protein